MEFDSDELERRLRIDWGRNLVDARNLLPPYEELAIGRWPDDPQVVASSITGLLCLSMSAESYELGAWLTQLLSVGTLDAKRDLDGYRIVQDRTWFKAKLELWREIDDATAALILQWLHWVLSFSPADSEVGVNAYDGIRYWTIRSGGEDPGANPRHPGPHPGSYFWDDPPEF